MRVCVGCVCDVCVCAWGVTCDVCVVCVHFSLAAHVMFAQEVSDAALPDASAVHFGNASTDQLL